MAKQNDTNEIVFGVWEPEVKVNPYAEIMTKFLAASETNPNAAYPLTVDSDKAVTERNKFAKAANDVNRTANLRKTTEADGKTTMLFTLGKRHKARRGTK